MQDLNLMSKQLKESILDDENLNDATDELRNDIEADVEGDFNFEAFEQFKSDYKSVMTSGLSYSRTMVKQAKKQHETVEEMENSEDFQDDRARGTISNQSYVKLRKERDYYRELYQHFATLLYGAHTANDKVMAAVDLQRNRSLQKQNLDFLKDNLPTVIKDAMDEGRSLESLESQFEERIDQLEKRIDELSDQEGSEMAEALEKEVQELQDELSEVKREVKQAEAEREAREKTEEEVSDQPELTEKDEGSEFEDVYEELTDGQSKILDIAEEMEDPDPDALAEELGWGVGIVKTQLKNIEKKNHELPDGLEA